MSSPTITERQPLHVNWHQAAVQASNEQRPVSAAEADAIIRAALAGGVSDAELRAAQSIVQRRNLLLVGGWIAELMTVGEAPVPNRRNLANAAAAARIAQELGEAHQPQTPFETFLARFSDRL